MKLGLPPDFTVKDFGGNAEAAQKMNNLKNLLVKALAGGLDPVSNWRGSQYVVDVTKGGSVVINTTSVAQYVSLFKIESSPQGVSLTSPSFWWESCSGGIKLFATWSGPATRAKLTVFVGTA